MATLAKQCAEEDPILRPDMKKIMITLSNILLSSVKWEATLAGNNQVFSGLVQEYIKPDIRDASIRLQPKREASVAWYLKSPFKVRGSALNTSVNNLTQTEVLTADTLFIMDEESDPVETVYSSCTTNVKIPRIFLESLAPRLKIEQPVIDAWADLLNFDERYKSAGSPSR
ncbi:hypothetical protein Tco_1574951, partial [Tanacetum coccineum]